MSYKPYRGSGIVFDKNNRSYEKHRRAVIQMIEAGEHLSFANLNRFSKHIYLSWLSDSKNSCSKNSIKFYCVYDLIYNMLERNKEKLYKPLQQLLTNRQTD